jgi:hypothetical protein
MVVVPSIYGTVSSAVVVSISRAVSVSVSVAVSGLLMKRLVRMKSIMIVMLSSYVWTARSATPTMVPPIIATIPIPTIIVTVTTGTVGAACRTW